jgi:hypothetical protein
MDHVHRVGRLVVAVFMLALASRATAEGLRLGASAGVGRAYDQTYYQLGGRLGYDVGFGITPEIGLSYWGGATPSFWQVSPGLTWYLPLPLLRPYLGGFYAHEFVSDGLPDQDGIGVRGGIGLLGAGPLSVNIGVAYERRLSCPADCDTWWPEASAGVSF